MFYRVQIRGHAKAPFCATEHFCVDFDLFWIIALMEDPLAEKNRPTPLNIQQYFYCGHGILFIPVGTKLVFFFFFKFHLTIEASAI